MFVKFLYPGEITLGQIVRLFEGQSELVECISNPQHCNMSDDCQVRLAWKDATRVMYEKLDSTTIADLVVENYSEKGEGQFENRRGLVADSAQTVDPADT
jgi:DNA-binding IscR family transcriptional regulator